MIAITPTVLNWYQQKKMPRLFKKVLQKQSRISIHTIIKENAFVKGKRNPDHYHYMANTLLVLKLVRKRGALTPDYLEQMTGNHQVRAQRILRGWQRAAKRQPPQFA